MNTLSQSAAYTGATKFFLSNSKDNSVKTALLWPDQVHPYFVITVFDILIWWMRSIVIKENLEKVTCNVWVMTLTDSFQSLSKVYHSLCYQPECNGKLHQGSKVEACSQTITEAPDSQTECATQKMKCVLQMQLFCVMTSTKACIVTLSVH